MRTVWHLVTVALIGLCGAVNVLAQEAGLSPKPRVVTMIELRSMEKLDEQLVPMTISNTLPASATKAKSIGAK